MPAKSDFSPSIKPNNVVFLTKQAYMYIASNVDSTKHPRNNVQIVSSADITFTTS